MVYLFEEMMLQFKGRCAQSYMVTTLFVNQVLWPREQCSVVSNGYNTKLSFSRCINCDIMKTISLTFAAFPCVWCITEVPESKFTMYSWCRLILDKFHIDIFVKHFASTNLNSLSWVHPNPLSAQTVTRT